jgi:hypothetical protein
MKQPTLIFAKADSQVHVKNRVSKQFFEILHLRFTLFKMEKEDHNLDSRLSLEDNLNDLLQKLFELSVIVYDFQPDGNKLVWKKM